MNDPARSREFNFLAICCGYAFQLPVTPLAEEAPGGLDWDRFIRLARFHRVQGLAWKGITAAQLALPPSPAAALTTDAKAIALNNLQVAAQSQALAAAFAQAGIALLFVKGLTLARIAYGECTSKAGSDVDVLVGAERLSAAISVLAERGYRLAQPEITLTSRDLGAWHDLRKESLWRHPVSGIYVDLHSRLADSPAMIPEIGLGSATQEVMVAPWISLPTLADEELFAYLAVHGASSAWFRLKWVTDFAAFTHRFAPDRLEQLYERSQPLGAGRAAAQALLVADAIYGTLGDLPGLADRLRGDRASRWLCAIALRQLAGRTEPLEPTAHRFGTAAIHYSQLLLRPGARFAAFEMLRQMGAIFASIGR